MFKCFLMQGKGDVLIPLILFEFYFLFAFLFCLHVHACSISVSGGKIQRFKVQLFHKHR
jgi:hypothetical protein